MKILRACAVVFGSALALSCNKGGDFLFVHPEPKIYTMNQTVKSVSGNGSVDLYWVVGGMTEQYANFQNGIGSFMTTFLTKGLDWRMSVVGDETGQMPYLGMTPIFDTSSVQPQGQMLTAMANAVNGPDGEELFDPLVSNLQLFPQFVRSNSTLVIIMTNDSYDFSFQYTTSAQVLNYLQSIRPSGIKNIVVYGIFGATDLNCDPATIDADWNYHGSEFENLINATGGKVYSLCDASFGQALASLGDDLYQHFENPRIPLDHIPIVSSIHVYYKGQELQGGSQASGGLWYYYAPTNSIIFYNLNFALQATDSVSVQYTEDTGVK